MCFYPNCEIGCPPGMTNSPLAQCECMKQCAYDELFTDEPVCKPGKTCTSKPEECPEGTTWNTEACMCFYDITCAIGCPTDYTNSPLSQCECMPQCEYDELFTDESVCGSLLGLTSFAFIAAFQLLSLI